MKRTVVLESARFALICLLLTAGAANAQSWSTSKDVNRVANPQLFTDEKLEASHLTASSVSNPASVNQKGVTRYSMKVSESSNRGNVVSKGTPAWVNSKGVSRFSNSSQAKKRSKVDVEQQVIPMDNKETKQ
jgi:hypothetical protein